MNRLFEGFPESVKRAERLTAVKTFRTARREDFDSRRRIRFMQAGKQLLCETLASKFGINQ